MGINRSAQTTGARKKYTSENSSPSDQESKVTSFALQSSLISTHAEMTPDLPPNILQQLSFKIQLQLHNYYKTN